MDFPVPLAPTSAVRSSGVMSQLAFSNKTRGPNRLPADESCNMRKGSIAACFIVASGWFRRPFDWRGVWLGFCFLPPGDKPGTEKDLVIAFGLIGIFQGKLADSNFEFARTADIAIESQRIARASVAAGEKLAANLRILCESVALQIIRGNGGFVIAQLTNEIVAIIDGRPAEKNIRLQLHSALTFGDPSPVVLDGALLAKIRSIGRARLLFDLQKQRVCWPIALQIIT